MFAFAWSPGSRACFPVLQDRREGGKKKKGFILGSAGGLKNKGAVGKSARKIEGRRKWHSLAWESFWTEDGREAANDAVIRETVLDGKMESNQEWGEVFWMERWEGSRK
jgi:hypothetical protein